MLFYELDNEVIRCQVVFPKRANNERFSIILSSWYIVVHINITEEQFFYDSHGFVLKIPFYFGGMFNFSLIYKKKEIGSGKINIPYQIKQNHSSSIMCYGNEDNNRYCKMSNICFNGKTIVILTNYSISLPKVFIPTGSHDESDHPNEAIIYNSCVSTSRNISFNSDYQKIESNAIVGSRYFNNQMLWHNVVDCLIPVFVTAKTNNLSFSNTKILLYDNFGKYGLYYLKMLSSIDIISKKSKICVRECIVGLQKYPRFFNSISKIQFNYTINPETVVGLREYILNHSVIAPDPKRPKIVIVSRKDLSSRVIINKQQLFESIKFHYPSARVHLLELETMDKLSQAKFISDASVLIGIHGSGLTHVLWMSPSSAESPTALLEILPYKYTCRNWYEMLAKAAKVKYFPIHTTSINNSTWKNTTNTQKINKCFASEQECLNPKCHDFLRDQSVTISISTIIRVLSGIL